MGAYKSRAGGGGGPSSCSSSTSTTCLGGYAKPAWQVGTFNDSVRDTPDISLFASNGFAGTFYVVCDQDANQDPTQACSLSGLNTTFQGYGGTSVASPALAGVFSILNQKLGARVGNANYALYNLVFPAERLQLQLDQWARQLLHLQRRD